MKPVIVIILQETEPATSRQKTKKPMLKADENFSGRLIELQRSVTIFMPNQTVRTVLPLKIRLDRNVYIK